MRAADPLVYGGLNLRELYERHTHGCQMDKRMKAPIIHAIVQWPKNLPLTESNQKAMLGHARKFLNDLLGGEAVFAARLDRDEKGEHVVDVFCSPIVTKTSAKGVQSRWVQTNSHMKALCEKHREEIIRRHPKIKAIDGPRQQGIALQSEWRGYLEGLGIKLAPKQEKRYGTSDWVPSEQLEINAQRAALEAREAAVAAREAEIAKPEVQEAIELLQGKETPAMREERETDEIEQHGMPFVQAWAINNGRELTWWEQVRYIVSYWRDRLGLGQQHDRGLES